MTVEQKTLSLDSTEIATINMLIRQEELHLNYKIAWFFSMIKDLQSEIHLEQNKNNFLYDTYQERSKIGDDYGRKNLDSINHYFKDLVESMQKDIESINKIKELTRIKLKLLGDVDFDGGPELIVSIQEQKKRFRGKTSDN